uniref:Protein GrpE n=1 Tax=Candidatus Methanophagaceae archaeon ANME-1 ERB6 TaxID=2759912 RepID=A0A7G9YYJ6_9EURY|nr:protein GrpE [Methanosarcinales archaeon ANME-1 ERB6]
MGKDSSSGNSRIKDFRDGVERLLDEVSICSNEVEAEIDKLTGMKGELSGIEKELERRKTMLEEKGEQELSDEELEEIGDAVEILNDELESKKTKTEAILREREKGEEAEKYLTDLTYLKAEFENYKRRAEKDKRDFADYLLEGVIAELLPIEDNLEVAIGHAKENKHSEGLVKGVEMTLMQFKEVLGREGVTEIKAEGEQFDPFRHEVVSKEVSEGHAENTVIEVVRKGYLFHEKVIRPAMVKIAAIGEE